MKKYIFSSSVVLLLLFFWGCEKDFNGIVDLENSSYKITEVYSFAAFSYAAGDSSLPLRVTFANDRDVMSVYTDIYDSEGKKLNSSPVQLFDNGNNANGDAAANDNIYSGLFPLSRSNPFGKYRVNYFVTDKIGARLVATHSFEYDNGQLNAPPVISNLVIADTVRQAESFTFTVTASDTNGLSDILGVYFRLYRPDGSLVLNTQENTDFFLMHDDGSEIFDDLEAGDGIYSFKNFFAAGSLTGDWKFEFEAVDRRGALSNKIIHNITVLQ
ncbi:MAG: hypothetical protein R6W90_08075 [Ignavibacteriaceae bacterium]